MTRKVWTAAELQAMDPSEVDAIFENSITWDLADAPQELLARSRERIMRRIEETEPTSGLDRSASGSGDVRVLRGSRPSAGFGVRTER